MEIYRGCAINYKRGGGCEIDFGPNSTVMPASLFLPRQMSHQSTHDAERQAAKSLINKFINQGGKGPY